LAAPWVDWRWSAETEVRGEAKVGNPRFNRFSENLLSLADAEIDKNLCSYARARDDTRASQSRIRPEA
jgi:hypothetical protein